MEVTLVGSQGLVAVNSVFALTGLRSAQHQAVTSIQKMIVLWEPNLTIQGVNVVRNVKYSQECVPFSEILITKLLTEESLTFKEAVNIYFQRNVTRPEIIQ
jgi:hypothetical protein